MQRIITCFYRQAVVKCSAPALCMSRCSEYDVTIMQVAKDEAQFVSFERLLNKIRKRQWIQSEKSITKEMIQRLPAA